MNRTLPELPEVEVTRRYIAPYIEGRYIEHFKVYPPNLCRPIDESVPKQVKGQQIVSVGRQGKYLLLELGSGCLIIHLGMSGNLRILDPFETRKKHDRAVLLFKDGSGLGYCDPRRFGLIGFAKCWQEALSKLGPDALTDPLEGVALKSLAAKHQRKKMKSFMMDQSVIAGLGNIYVNEALFRAGISPVRAAGRVGLSRYKALALAIKEVLTEAIKAGGTTLEDGTFVGNNSQPGQFQLRLQVYGRSGEPCLNCQGKLKEVRTQNRSTVYCQRCQK